MTLLTASLAEVYADQVREGHRVEVIEQLSEPAEKPCARRKAPTNTEED